MPVVTISGNMGGGAREVGQAVARVLEIDFVDQQLLVEAARRSGVPLKTIAEHDERPARFRERLASILRAYLERSAAGGVDPSTGAIGLEALFSRSYAEMAAEREEPELTDDLYIKTITAVIREMAARGNMVILGRGSQMILADFPGALHVLCHAPVRLRIERFAQREGISPGEAAHRVAESDRGLAAFYRKFWKVDMNAPALYDLAIDTSRLSIEVAADLVATAARAKETSGG